MDTLSYYYTTPLNCIKKIKIRAMKGPCFWLEPPRPQSRGVRKGVCGAKTTPPCLIAKKLPSNLTS